MGLTTSHELRRLLAEPAPRSDAHVLEATLACIVRHGLDRTTVDDVAARAGIGRATLFRRFGSKDALFHRAMVHAGLELLDQVESAVAGIADPVERLVELTAAAAAVIRADVVVRRLIEDRWLEDLAAASPLSDLARQLARNEVAEAAAQLGAGGAVDVDAIAEAVIRLLVSLAFAPTVGGATVDDDLVRRIARVMFLPLHASRPASGRRR